ncbi:hypothetical protein E2C01_001509 [Portunus trituberculatus]|uniref:Uncharacterized protein n=1 Tax=Portunus trituberculatus TaxID=210409 RepID=A0A5B7CJG3_PORTR|nr:hypothetical protein [Portunus trituberculatus]
MYIKYCVIIKKSFKQYYKALNEHGLKIKHCGQQLLPNNNLPGTDNCAHFNIRP